MTEDTIKDLGLAMAVLERMTTQRLPQARVLEEKLGRGEALDDFDITFLHETFHHLQHIQHLVDHHPEYQDLYGRVAVLLKGITESALKNEKGPGSTVLSSGAMGVPADRG